MFALRPGDGIMTADEPDRLAACPELLDLLAHYADLAADDRQAWHPRLPAAADGGPPAALYGELLAYGWAEQNTGHTEGDGDPLGRCYRATPAGLRALREARAGAIDA